MNDNSNEREQKNDSIDNKEKTDDLNRDNNIILADNEDSSKIEVDHPEVNNNKENLNEVQLNSNNVENKFETNENINNISTNHNLNQQEEKENKGESNFIQVDVIKGEEPSKRIIIPENIEEIENIEKKNDIGLTGGDDSVNLINIEMEKEKDSYLKSKLANLNLSNNIVKGINNEMEKSLHQIENDIKDNKLCFPKDSKEISEIFPLNISTKRHIENEESKYKLKTLKNLKKSEEKLQNEINQLEQNKKILKSESFNNISNSVIELNKKKSELKDLSERQNNLIGKLNHIKSQIDKLIENETKVDRRSNIKEFLNKFTKNNNVINNSFDEKIQLLEEERVRLENKRLEDLKRSKEKKIKIMEEKEKNELNQKLQNLEEKRLKEKELIYKRKKEIDEIVLKEKLYIHNKFQKNNQYLYEKMKKKYEKDESDLFEKIKYCKKSKLTTKEEIDEADRRFKFNKCKIEQDAIDKVQKMKKMWRTNSLEIPKYRSPLLKVMSEEEQKLKENEQNMKIKLKLLLKEKVLFSDNKVPKPELNEKLKKEREERIIGLKNPSKKERVESIKLLNRRIKETKRNIINSIYKKKDAEVNVGINNLIGNITNVKNNPVIAKISAITSKQDSFNNSRIEEAAKLKEEVSHLFDNSPNKSDIHFNPKLKDDRINRKRKRLNMTQKEVISLPNKYKDYQREIKTKNNRSSKSRYIASKIINSNSITLTDKFDDIQNAKNKVEVIDNKVHQKQELLRINGGFVKNPALANNVSDLLIDSIKAKLAIIDCLNLEK